MAPLLARHWNEIHLNDKLFARLNVVHRRPDGLTTEQARVLERYHAMFRRAGAGLDAAAKQRLKEIAERLASLGTTFGQNVLADEQSYVMPLGEDDSPGCRIACAAARTADERGLKGQHAVTLTLQRRAISQFRPARAARKGVPCLIARGDNGGRPTSRDRR
jgi:peptidyl-dipeptidase Dcp